MVVAAAGAIAWYRAGAGAGADATHVRASARAPCLRTAAMVVGDGSGFGGCGVVAGEGTRTSASITRWIFG